MATSLFTDQGVRGSIPDFFAGFFLVENYSKAILRFGFQDVPEFCWLQVMGGLPFLPMLLYVVLIPWRSNKFNKRKLKKKFEIYQMTELIGQHNICRFSIFEETRALRFSFRRNFFSLDQTQTCDSCKQGTTPSHTHLEISVDIKVVIRFINVCSGGDTTVWR